MDEVLDALQQLRNDVMALEDAFDFFNFNSIIIAIDKKTELAEKKLKAIHAH